MIIKNQPNKRFFKDTFQASFARAGLSLWSGFSRRGTGGHLLGDPLRQGIPPGRSRAPAPRSCNGARPHPGAGAPSRVRAGAARWGGGAPRAICGGIRGPRKARRPQRRFPGKGQSGAGGQGEPGATSLAPEARPHRTREGSQGRPLPATHGAQGSRPSGAGSRAPAPSPGTAPSPPQPLGGRPRSPGPTPAAAPSPRPARAGCLPRAARRPSPACPRDPGSNRPSESRWGMGGWGGGG